MRGPADGVPSADDSRSDPTATPATCELYEAPPRPVTPTTLVGCRRTSSPYSPPELLKDGDVPLLVDCRSAAVLVLEEKWADDALQPGAL